MYKDTNVKVTCRCCCEKTECHCDTKKLMLHTECPSDTQKILLHIRCQSDSLKNCYTLNVTELLNVIMTH